MKELVRQRADDDCTICAISMATGQPYERVLAVAAATQGGYRYGGTAGTMSPKAVLIALGFDARRLGGPEASPRVLWGRRAIVSLPSLNGFNGHHDVYWDGHILHDPTEKQRYRPDALDTVSVLSAVLLDEQQVAP